MSISAGEQAIIDAITELKEAFEEAQSEEGAEKKTGHHATAMKDNLFLVLMNLAILLVFAPLKL